MLKIYYGDRDRLDLYSSLLYLNIDDKNTIITSHYNIDISDIYRNYFYDDDIFGNRINNVICKCENKIECKDDSVLNKLKKNSHSITIFHYGEKPINKNSKIYKSMRASDFVELISVHDGFGGIKEQELGNIKNAVLDYLKKDNRTHAVISDLEEVIIYLLKYSHYNSMLNDIQSWLEIQEVYGENSILDIKSLTEPMNDYFLMSITNSIYDMDINSLYSYLKNENIEYSSVLIVLQNMYYNISRAMAAYSDNNYQIDFSDLKFRVPDINKYGIYRAIKYINAMGYRRINYIYNYINSMLNKECSSFLPYSKDMKMQDLGRVICGRQSIFID